MNRFLSYFAYHGRAAWALVIAFSLLGGALIAISDIHRREGQRVSLLQTEARRSSIEIMSSTLNGNLMGSITLLGLIDRDIKQEVSNGLLSIDAHIPITLSTLGNSFEAEGVFLVGEDGIVKSSWDRINKPSTGLDVSFRPYYKMAMKGQTNVYAAISMARGDRSLYFTAPVYSERARATSGIGAIVARTNLDRVDALLKGKFDQALLLSPQGVVFASTNPQWVGLLEGIASAERLKAIRDLKQFGPLFEKSDPLPLPVTASAGIQTVDGQRFAIGLAPVQWNDPSGDWNLIVMEDLGQSAAPQRSLGQGIATVALGLLLGWMWIHLLRGRRTQDEASAQLKMYAQQQERQVVFRARLADTSIRLQRCESLEDLARVFLLEVRDMLGVVQGTVYAVTSADAAVLQLVGSSACAQPPVATLSLGEGLLGQCARERRTQLILTPPDGIWTVRSGLGDSQPAALFLAPLVLHESLIGAVELAVLQAPTDTAKSQFEEVVALLANTMEILRRNLLLQQLHHTSPVIPLAEPA
jgi:C4-dicarboxylate-specific signal transduction histidine kinase